MGVYWADWEEKRREGEGRGWGECEEIDMEKEEKITNVILTCSCSHYIPQLLSLENMQQHTKTATIFRLQAPLHNSLGQTSATASIAFVQRRKKRTQEAEQAGDLTCVYGFSMANELMIK